MGCGSGVSGSVLTSTGAVIGGGVIGGSVISGRGSGVVTSGGCGVVVGGIGSSVKSVKLQYKK
jgi:hypothetical protein